MISQKDIHHILLNKNQYFSGSHIGFGVRMKWVYFKTINSLMFGWLKVLSIIFNNISVILWPSVLLVEETGVPGENHRPATSR